MKEVLKMKFEAKLIEAISQKTGNPYVAIDIQLSPYYSKRVFLSAAESALVDSVRPHDNENTK